MSPWASRPPQQRRLAAPARTQFLPTLALLAVTALALLPFASANVDAAQNTCNATLAAAINATCPVYEEAVTHHGNAAGLEALFIVLLSLLIGGLAKHLTADIAVPYSVTLLIIGVAMGLVAKHFGDDGKYLEMLAYMGDIDPHFLLFAFLPMLIFESSYTLNFHIFRKELGAIAVLAGPGVLLSSALTGTFTHYFLDYNFSWSFSLLLGCILSATDPVAVVSLLRDLGTSPTLATLIEGESLLNDGTSIVLFVIIKSFVIDEQRIGSVSLDAGEIIWQVVWIAGFAPIVGLVCAWVTVAMLKRVWNAAVIEITITLSMSYITYYLAEIILEVSGVLAVVVLGLYLNVYGRTSITQEVEHFLHQFYEVLAYMANTLIFLICGIIAAFKVNFDGTDFGNLLFLYFAIHVIRAFSIFVLSPLLRHTGYGLSFNFGVVLMWGGLRGSVGLALALVVVLEQTVWHTYDGSKMLFFVAGIVVLTLTINAMTISSLLSILGMNRVSVPKMISQHASILHLNTEVKKKMMLFANDPFLCDANWPDVRQLIYEPDVPVLPASLRNWNTSIMHRATVRRDAIQRLLKAQKLSYWHQYGEGLLGQQALLALIEVTECCHDNNLMVTDDKLVKYLHIQESDLSNRLHTVPVLGSYFRRRVYRKIELSFHVALGFLRSQEEILTLFDDMTVATDSNKGKSVSTDLREGSDDLPLIEKTSSFGGSRAHGGGDHGNHSGHEHGSASSCAFVVDEIVHNELYQIIMHAKNEVHKRVLTLREAYPEFAMAIKTSIAVNGILHFEKTLIKNLLYVGTIEGAQAVSMQDGLAGCTKALRQHPPRLHFPRPDELLSSLPWIKGICVEIDEVTRILTSSCAKDAAKDMVNAVASGHSRAAAATGHHHHHHHHGGHVIGHYMREFNLKDGCKLFSEGDLCDGVYVIGRGVARVVAGDKVLSLVGPGEMFGELGVLRQESHTRTACVEAETYVYGIHITSAGLFKLFSEHSRGQHMYNALWTYTAVKFAVVILKNLPPYNEWDLHNLRCWVQHGRFLDCTSCSSESNDKEFSKRRTKRARRSESISFSRAPTQLESARESVSMSSKMRTEDTPPVVVEEDQPQSVSAPLLSAGISHLSASSSTPTAQQQSVDSGAAGPSVPMMLPSAHQSMLAEASPDHHIEVKATVSSSSSPPPPPPPPPPSQVTPLPATLPIDDVDAVQLGSQTTATPPAAEQLRVPPREPTIRGSSVIAAVAAARAAHAVKMHEIQFTDLKYEKEHANELLYVEVRYMVIVIQGYVEIALPAMSAGPERADSSDDDLDHKKPPLPIDSPLIQWNTNTEQKKVYYGPLRLRCSQNPKLLAVDEAPNFEHTDVFSGARENRTGAYRPDKEQVTSARQLTQKKTHERMSLLRRKSKEPVLAPAESLGTGLQPKAPMLMQQWVESANVPPTTHDLVLSQDPYHRDSNVQRAEADIADKLRIAQMHCDLDQRASLEEPHGSPPLSSGHSPQLTAQLPSAGAHQFGKQSSMKSSLHAPALSWGGNNLESLAKLKSQSTRKKRDQSSPAHL